MFDKINHIQYNQTYTNKRREIIMKKMVKNGAKAAVMALALLLCAGLGCNTAEAAKKVKISKTKLMLKVGQSKTLSVKNLSKKKKKKLKWTSNNKKVATVSKKGKVKAKKAGKAKITAKVGKKKYTCKVTVKKKTPTTTGNTTDKDKTPTPPAKTKQQLAAEDRANLTALIKKQRAAGAQIPEDLTDGYHYGFNEDGRLRYLNLSEDEGSDLKLSGEIDVTMFTALETLKIDYNRKITGVRTTGVTTLKELSLDETAVTVLDVRTNVNLEKLYLCITKITSLDVTKNTKLQSLCFYKTQIKKLDISKNTALESLICYDAGLTSLDVSKNPLLTRIHCSGNNIKTLDLSGLKKEKQVEVTCDKGVTVTGTNSKVTVEYRDSKN